MFGHILLLSILTKVIFAPVKLNCTWLICFCIIFYFQTNIGNNARMTTESIIGISIWVVVYLIVGYISLLAIVMAGDFIYLRFIKKNKKTVRGEILFSIHCFLHLFELLALFNIHVSGAKHLNFLKL